MEAELDRIESGEDDVGRRRRRLLRAVQGSGSRRSRGSIADLKQSLDQGDRGALREVRRDDGGEVGKERPVPRVLGLSGVQVHEAPRGGGAPRSSTSSARSAARRWSSSTAASASSSAARTTPSARARCRFRRACRARRRTATASSSSAARREGGRSTGAATYPECELRDMGQAGPVTCPSCQAGFMVEKSTKGGARNSSVWSAGERRHPERETDDDERRGSTVARATALNPECDRDCHSHVKTARRHQEEAWRTALPPCRRGISRRPRETQLLAAHRRPPTGVTSNASPVTCRN